MLFGNPFYDSPEAAKENSDSESEIQKKYNIKRSQPQSKFDYKFGLGGLFDSNRFEE